MRILVTNDDGIEAPGIVALAQALTQIGEVTVVAPDRQRSASGHSITLHKPLRVHEANISAPGIRAFSTNGTPSDCVVLGALVLIDGGPELVVSGINPGPNLGDDVTYSGTVAAAMEGAMMGAPSFAVSIAVQPGDDRELDYGFAAGLARRLASRLVETGLPPDCFLNVNVPACAPDEITGVEVTRLGRRRWDERLVKRADPRGRPYYWLVGEPQLDGAAAGTDVAAVLARKVSITPAHMDLTRHQALESLRHLAEALGV
ncbi:MAG: 5'/3'-nucleotidase SurE [Armatimonadota bacterium]